MSDPFEHLAHRIEELRRLGLWRESRPVQSQPRIDLSSNDYLGYAKQDLEVAGGWGAGASRVVAAHAERELEAESVLAEWVGLESALLFSSGYAANVGTLSALAGPGDLIVSDELNHASIIDGCRLSRASVVVVGHLDVAAMAAALGRGCEGRRWVVTESHFSMDGDVPDLRALRRLCDDSGAGLIVDEAHALGVFGPQGAGLCAEAGARPDVLIGTLGKALGLAGAFVAGPEVLRAWLWNKARSFVFSTGISPALASAVGPRVARCRADDVSRRRVIAIARRFMLATGLQGFRGPILSWRFGQPAAAVLASEFLRERGVRVWPMRPPTVPAGTSRLRITASAGLTDGDVDVAVAALASLRGASAIHGTCFT